MRTTTEKRHFRSCNDINIFSENGQSIKHEEGRKMLVTSFSPFTQKPAPSMLFSAFPNNKF